ARGEHDHVRAETAPGGRGRAARTGGEGEVVDVPAGVVLVDGQGLGACGQGDAGCDGGPGLVAAGGRGVDVPAQVRAGGAGDVQGVGDRVRGGQAQADRVGSGGGDVDGVFEPLPGGGPAQVVAAARVGGGLEVNPVGPVAVGGAVDRGDVVGHALAAGVVVLCLHGARYRRRGAAVRAFGGGVGDGVCAHHGRTGQDRDCQGRQDLGE